LTETAPVLGVTFAPATAAGLTEDADTRMFFAVEVTWGAEVPAFPAAAVTETAALDPELAGFAAAETFAGAAAATLFPAAVAGFPTATAFTETAFFCTTEVVFAVPSVFLETAFPFGAVATAAPLNLAPLGDGFPGCEVCNVPTVTVAGAAGVCTAVGVCATAAPDRSMSIPRFRIIYVLPLAVAGVAAG